MEMNDEDNVSKTYEDSFDVMEFKNRLRDSAKSVKALKDFVERARNPKNVDVVHQFLQESESTYGIELIRIMTKDRSISEVVHVFQAFQYVFLRIADDLKNYHAWGVAVIKQLMEPTYTRVINKGLLATNSSKVINATLNFLTSMVAISAAAAKVIVLRFRFSESILLPLFLKTKIKKSSDVRISAIHFILSFLMSNDRLVIEKIIQRKGIIHGIFPGLIYDRLSTIQLFLRTLISQVVENALVTKTIKITIFNDFTLKSIFNLLYWTGPKDFPKGTVIRKLNDNEKESLLIDESTRVAEDTAAVQQLAHDFILALCSSKNGIRFIDKTAGTSGRNFNHIISSLLSSVKKPYEDPVVERTIIDILRACPDQVPKYLSSLSKIVEPSSTSQWLKTISFAVNVLKSCKVMSCVKYIDNKTPPLMLASIVEKFFQGLSFNHDKISALLNHECFIIRDTALFYLKVLLDKASRFLMDVRGLKMFCWNITDIKLFEDTLSQKLIRHLPKLSDLLRCWNSAVQEPQLLTKYLNKDDVLQNGLPSSDELPIHLKMLLNTIILYIKLTPFSSEQNISLELLTGVDDLQTRMTEMCFNEIQVLVLNIVGNCCNSSTLSVKIGNKTVAYRLLEFTQYTTNEVFRKQAMNVLKKLLVATELFLSNEAEVDIWLHTFCTPCDAKLVIVPFFEAVIIELITNSQFYIDTMYKSFLQSSFVANTEETPSRVFDAILMENDSKDIIKDLANYHSIFSSRLQFSPMIFVAFNILKTTQTNRSDICRTFTKVVCGLLHSQYHPEVLCQIIQPYCNFFQKFFKKYLKLFDSSSQVYFKNAVSRKDVVIEDESVDEILRMMFEMRTPLADVLPHDCLESLIIKTSQEDVLQIIRQILSYLNIILKLNNKADFMELMEFYCKLMNSLMNVRRNKLDCKCSESVCESDHLCDDCDAFQDLMGQVVLSHPIIQSSFLHEDLTNKGSESQSLLMLTHLALELIEKVKNFNKTTYFPVYQSKMGRFFLNSVSFLIKNRPKDSKSLYSLIARLDTYLPYLTTEHLQSLMDNFLWVPLNTLVSFKKKEATLTQLGKFFIKIFNFLTAIMQSSNESTLSAGHVRHCCEVYMQLKHETESHMKDTYAKYQIGYSLSNLLECNDLCALLFHEDMFKHCLEDCTASINQKFAISLLERNPTFIPVFENWFLEKKIRSEHTLNYMPVTLAYLNRIRRDTCIFISENRTAVLKDLVEIYWSLILKLLFGNHNANLEMACYLLNLFLELNAIEMSKIIDFVKLMMDCSHPAILNSRSLLLSSAKAFTMLSINNQLVNDIDGRTAFIVVCLKAVFDCAKTESDINITYDKQLIIDHVINQLESGLQTPNLGQVLHKLKLWHMLMKTTLKIGLKNERGSNVLRLLKLIIDRLYNNKEFLPFHARSVFGLVFGHSRFLPGLLDVSMANDKWRELLLDLLLLLIKIEPSICHKDHLPIYLGSYRASLLPVDQKLLRLIYCYEKQGVDMQDFKPLIFGEHAIEHYSILKKLKYGLWKRPSVDEVITMLDHKKLLNSALQFPLRMELMIEDESDNFCVPSESPEKMYDPRFVLPLLSHLISPDSLLHFSKFIRCNGLAFVIAALGSESDNMRAVGYHILSNLYHHLESSRVSLSLRYLYLLDIIRNAIEYKNVKLSNIVVVFLIEVCQLLLSGGVLSKPIIKFLFIKPVLDVWTVPDFTFLFNSSQKEHNRLFRSWILSVIHRGLRTPIDYYICQRRDVFTVIFSAMETSVQKRLTLQSEIMKILMSVANIPTAILDLCKRGVLAVLNNMLKDCTDTVLNEAVDILYTSWNSLVREDTIGYDGSDQNVLESNASSLMADGAPRRTPHLNRILISEFILTLISLSQRLSVDLSLSTFNKYVSTLASLLRWTPTGVKQHTPVTSLSCSFISNLANLCQRIVKKGDLKAASPDGNFLPENSQTRILDTFDFSENLALSKSCQESVCEIFLHWECHSLMLNGIQSSSLEICAIFTSVSSYLLESLLPFKNYFQMRKVYSWLNNHLEDNTLAVSLIQSEIESCDIVSHIFKAYEYLLINMNENEEKIVEGSIENSKTLRTAVIVELCKLLVLVLKNAETASFSKSSNTDVKSKDKLSSVTWLSLQKMMCTPVLQNLINDLLKDDDVVQAQAAIIISFLAIELRLSAKEVDDFEKNFESLCQKYYKTYVNQELKHTLFISNKRPLNSCTSPKSDKKMKKKMAQWACQYKHIAERL